MRPTRRQLLVATPAVLLACKVDHDSKDSGGVDATPERTPENPDWEPEGTLDEVAFAWGLQSGDATDQSVILSVRSTHTELTFVVMREDGDGWAEHTRQTVTRTDETVQIEVADLNRDAAYRWAVFGPDNSRSRVGRFRSAGGGTALRVLRVGATSCLGGNEPWPNLIHAAEEDFDVFLLLGDTVYADEATELEDYRGYWRTAMALEGLKAVTARSSIIATWDDHEVGNNWIREELAEGQFEAALQAYRESLPQRTGNDGGIWRKVSWGAVCDFFVLDCRGEREAPDQYISAAQMDWAKREIAASTARFKLILNSVPITDFTDMIGEVEVEDRWQGYPAQRTELLTALRDVPGVLWLAGDFHFGMMGNVDLPGSGGPAEGAWEVMAGPSGSFLNPVGQLYEDDTGQFPVIVGAWNYVRLGLDPGTGEVVVDFIGDDGSVLATKTVVI